MGAGPIALYGLTSLFLVLQDNGAFLVSAATVHEFFHDARHVLGVIGQAKGVLMEPNKITVEQAFALLAKTSQDTNRKIVEVADYLTHTGAFSPEGGYRAATRHHPTDRQAHQDRR